MEKPRRLRNVLRAAASALALSGTPAEATPRTPVAIEQILPSEPMLRGGEARPPQAFVELCERLAALCEAQDKSPRELAKRRSSFEKDLEELSDVNTYVNTNVKPETDSEQYGVADRWDIAKIGGAGDCEDYVLLKRELLLKKGWQPQDLLITVVKDEQGNGHAILTVRTEKGEFVLDNRKPDVVPWTVSRDIYGYTFYEIESYLNPRVWFEIKNGSSAGYFLGPMAPVLPHD